MSAETHSQLNIDRFNDIAASWDEHPGRVETAQAVARAMLEVLGLRGDERALEFGCGTGLVTALLASSLRHVTAADSAPGMLEVLERKRSELGLDNVETLRADLSVETPTGAFDLIFSSMTLHHIKDVEALFRRLAGMLAPGGRVALADLEAEDGTFHGPDKPGIAHNGFERADIEAWLRAAGLEDVRLTTAHVVHKVGADDRPHDYPIFLATARKPG